MMIVGFLNVWVVSKVIKFIGFVFNIRIFVVGLIVVCWYVCIFILRGLYMVFFLSDIFLGSLKYMFVGWIIYLKMVYK